MLTEQQRYFFDVNGYVVLPDVLKAEEVAHLNDVLDSQQLPIPGDDIMSQRFWDEFLHWDPACRDLIDNEAVLPIVQELCGSYVRLDHAYGIIMNPQTGGLGLHGGAVPFDPAQFYLASGGKVRSGLTVVSFSLVDVPRGSGGFCCIPGSHKAEFALPAEVDTSMVVHVDHGPGSVVIFTEALTHGTLPWTAEYQRRHLLFKYSPGNSAWQKVEGAHEGLELTERQSRLLEPPYVGYRKPVEN